MPMGKVAVVGSVNMDLVVNTPRMPKLGETIIGHGFMTAPGGKGANQACAAARLGGEVRMLARVGDDAFGRQLREHLEDSGVITDDVKTVPDTPSGTATIVVHQGDNFIVIDPGANHRLTPADVQAFAERIAEADVVLVQLEVPLETVEETVRVSKAAGTPVVLNPAPAAELSAETLAGLTWLTPNEGEAAMLAGTEPAAGDTQAPGGGAGRAGGGHAPADSTSGQAAGGHASEESGRAGGGHAAADSHQAAAGASAAADSGADNAGIPDLERTVAALKCLGVTNICITLGAQGVAFSDEDGGITRLPAEKVTPIDTTAAGDVFNGAFAVALTEGRPVTDAIAFAQRASAISVTRPGAGPSIPTRDEVEG